MLRRTRSRTDRPEARVDIDSDDEKERRHRNDNGTAAEADADDAVSNENDAAVITVRIPVLVGTESWSDEPHCCRLHLLPCHVRANGQAAVSRFFQPQQVINPTLLLLPAADADTAASASAPASASSPSVSSYIPAALPSAASSSSYLTQPVTAPPSSAAAAAAVASSCWYISAFRGREMTGEKRRLPADCIGLLLRTGREGRTSWRVQSRFQSLFLWHRDQDWRGDDRSLLTRTMTDWPRIAAALHG